MIKKVLVVCMLYASCTANCNEEQDYKGIDGDPFECINRPIFEFNKKLDQYVLRSAATAYIELTNSDFRECSYNFFYNLSMPLNAVSNLFKLNIKDSLKTVARFVINTTLGFFGFFDPASKAKIYVKHCDMRTVLRDYGIHGRPYMVLPVLGSSSPRDIIGTVCNVFLDPFYYILPEAWMWRRRMASAIAERSENYNSANEILYKSVAPYETVRSSKLDKDNKD